MKYQVEKQGSNVSVRIEDVGGQEQAVVETIRLCRQSAWACQSGECLNVEAIEDRVEPGRVLLTLIPRPGAQIDPSGIDTCLRFALARF